MPLMTLLLVQASFPTRGSMKPHGWHQGFQQTAKVITSHLCFKEVQMITTGYQSQAWSRCSTKPSTRGCQSEHEWDFFTTDRYMQQLQHCTAWEEAQAQRVQAGPEHQVPDVPIQLNTGYELTRELVKTFQPRQRRQHGRQLGRCFIPSLELLQGSSASHRDQ